MANITLLGASYTDVPAVDLPQTGGGTVRFYENGGGSATLITKSITANGTYSAEDDDADGYSEVTVNVPTSSTPTPYVIRPDAELIQTYTFDQYAVADLGLTLPTYTTSAKTLKGSESLPTVSIDLNSYRYIVVERFLSIPEYSITTLGKGRVEYVWANYIYEIARSAANEFPTIINPTKKITAAQNMVVSSYLYRLLYWTSSSAIALYSSNTYGVYQVPTAATVSDTLLYLLAPALNVRGHATYFTSTYMNALTDIRYQYVIEVYRAPIGTPSGDGWEHNQLVQHMIECINSDGHKLT